ncbi:hypothetical protein [Streptomyces sp. NPDC021608]|uniref:hypothetical protein n=1 Tax=Streptomyces sp. NPDC021608 TaxID=3154903 RepID=UPI0033D69893
MTTHATTQVKSFSFGGGVQSMAVMVLAATGELDYRTFLMGNVGDDSEHPGTLRYLHRHAIPYAEAHGLELVVLDRVMKRSGEVRTLDQDLPREGSRSLKIPIRMSNGPLAPAPVRPSSKSRSSATNSNAAGQRRTPRRRSGSASASTRSTGPTSVAASRTSTSNTRCAAGTRDLPNRLRPHHPQRRPAGAAEVAVLIARSSDPRHGTTCAAANPSCSNAPASSKNSSTAAAPDSGKTTCG